MIRIGFSNRKGIWHNGSTIDESFWLAKTNPINVQPNYPNAVKAQKRLSKWNVVGITDIIPTRRDFQTKIWAKNWAIDTERYFGKVDHFCAFAANSSFRIPLYQTEKLLKLWWILEEIIPMAFLIGCNILLLTRNFFNRFVNQVRNSKPKNIGIIITLLWL